MSSDSLVGWWNPKELPGPITGSGEGFKDALRKFEAREAKKKLVGTWRKAPANWKKNKGKYVDPDYYIVNY